MREMFLVGRHIGHSLSPAMWNHVFTSTGTPIRYGLRDVDETGLASVADEIRSPDVVAANVTMPHKAWAASVASTLDEAARRTGAVNLLTSDGTALHGRNTDVTGAHAVLSRRAPYRSVVILGAGGTAAAVLAALSGLCERVVLVNRTRRRATDLARGWTTDAIVEVADWESRDRVVGDADLVVNTVPVVDRSPFDVGAVAPGAALYDVIYRSEPTVLQVEATSAGIPIADGLAHLAAQAIAMLEPLGFDPGWTGLLVEGLEIATGRTVEAWGTRLG